MTSVAWADVGADVDGYIENRSIQCFFFLFRMVLGCLSEALRLLSVFKEVCMWCMEVGKGFCQDLCLPAMVSFA